MSQVSTDNVGHVNWGQSPDRPANAKTTLGAVTSTSGASVTVTFANEYASTPRAVLVQGQATDSSAGDIFDATWTAAGFTIIAAAGATKSYVVKYFVVW